MLHLDPCGNLTKAENSENLTNTDNSEGFVPPYREELDATGLVPGSGPATPGTPGPESWEARRARPPKWG